MRPRVDRVSLFKMLALNWNRKKIKKEGKISEATFWRVKAEYNRLSEDRKEKIGELATGEKKAREKFGDYEFVQRWVARMNAERVKSWKQRFNDCRRIWLILQRKNPENWTEDDVKIRAIPELRKTMKSVFEYLIAVRSLCPDLKEKLSTKREKLEPSFEWKYVYERVTQEGKLEDFFKAGGFKAELLKRLHVTLGCREGSKGIGGILGVEWDRINWKNKTIDVYEGKTGGGFYWLNCPLTLFGDHAFEMLQQYWIEQGKPTSGKIFDVAYMRGLRNIYKETAKAINEPYGSKGITPHFARKLHASLLMDADVPLEMVAGDKPFGIMGVGWEDLTTLKKYYLAFRREKVQEARMLVRMLVCA